MPPYTRTLKRHRDKAQTSAIPKQYEAKGLDVIVHLKKNWGGETFATELYSTNFDPCSARAKLVRNNRLCVLYRVCNHCHL